MIGVFPQLVGVRICVGSKLAYAGGHAFVEHVALRPRWQPDLVACFVSELPKELNIGNHISRKVPKKP